MIEGLLNYFDEKRNIIKVCFENKPQAKLIDDEYYFPFKFYQLNPKSVSDNLYILERKKNKKNIIIKVPLI